MYVEMKNIYKKYGDFLASNESASVWRRVSWWRFWDRREAERRHFSE